LHEREKEKEKEKERKKQKKKTGLKNKSFFQSRPLAFPLTLLIRSIIF
jgi:hypothetical protein